MFPFGQFPIRFEDELRRFLEVLEHFVERGALGIGAWKLLVKTDVACRYRYVDGSELHVSDSPCEYGSNVDEVEDTVNRHPTPRHGSRARIPSPRPTEANVRRNWAAMLFWPE